MDEQMKSRLTSRDVWVRGLYLLFFAIAWGLSELLLSVCVLFQFLTVLFTGSANERLLTFGENLSRYHYQIARFVSFNTEDKPFPFSDWPDEKPGGERWRDQSGGPRQGDDHDAEPTEFTAEQSADEPAAESAEGSAEAPTEGSAEAPSGVSTSRKDEFPPPA